MNEEVFKSVFYAGWATAQGEAAMNPELIVHLISALCVLAIYFAPTIVAACYKRGNLVKILLINLFAGWTLIGWVMALIWAIPSAAEEKQEAKRQCPFCAETIKAEARVCKFCQRDLPQVV